jgi:hypothetical protein
MNAYLTGRERPFELPGFVRNRIGERDHEGKNELERRRFALTQFASVWTSTAAKCPDISPLALRCAGAETGPA